MIAAALLSIIVYALVAVLRARHRFLTWERFWSAERRALRALRRIG